MRLKLILVCLFLLATSCPKQPGQSIDNGRVYEFGYYGFRNLTRPLSWEDENPTELSMGRNGLTVYYYCSNFGASLLEPSDFRLCGVRIPSYATDTSKGFLPDEEIRVRAIGLTKLSEVNDRILFKIDFDKEQVLRLVDKQGSVFRGLVAIGTGDLGGDVLVRLRGI